MQDVADHAGVSCATVSLALRNNPSIPPQTRQRIQAIAQTLGYRPNPLVSTLMSHLRMTQKPNYAETLGYITAWPTRNAWRKLRLMHEFYLGAEERAAQLGYKLEEIWIKEPSMTGAIATRILQARGIRGLVVAPLPAPRGHLSLDWSQFTAAAIGYTLWKPDLHRAVNYQFHSITLALRQLRRLGYRRVGLVMSMFLDQRVDHNWMAGFLVYQQFRRGKDLVPMLVTRNWTEEVFRRWFHKHRPDALVTMNEEIMDWLRRMKLKIPQDIGYVALDNCAVSPHCAAIDQQPRLVGAAAVDLVIGQLQRNEYGIPSAPKVVLIKSCWIEGRTVRDQRLTRHQQSRRKQKV